MNADIYGEINELPLLDYGGNYTPNWTINLHRMYRNIMSSQLNN